MELLEAVDVWNMGSEKAERYTNVFGIEEIFLPSWDVYLQIIDRQKLECDETLIANAIFHHLRLFKMKAPCVSRIHAILEQDHKIYFITDASKGVVRTHSKSKQYSTIIIVKSFVK